MKTNSEHNIYKSKTEYFPRNTERNKDVNSHHFYSTSYWRPYWSQYNKTRKRTKRFKTRKEVIILSLFTDNMNIYAEHFMKNTKKMLELISEVSKIAGQKINILKSTVFMNKLKLK